MTCSEQVRSIDNSFESLGSAVDSYLDELSRRVSDSTFWSHQTVITKFREWIPEPYSSTVCLESYYICQFVEDLSGNSSHEISTIGGYLDSLINLQSFIHREDPYILKERLLSEIKESDVLEDEEIDERIGPNILCGDLQNTSMGVSALVTYLRQCRFGTRGHAYVELMLDTCSRPGCVRDLELEDFNSDNDTVTISIPETHLVSSAGLVTQRVANISPETSEALEEFITYGRKEPTAATDRPLLTTSHGRASESTLRREVKQASGNADEYPRVATPLPHDQVSCVVPSEIWRYSILQHLEGQ